MTSLVLTYEQSPAERRRYSISLLREVALCVAPAGALLLAAQPLLAAEALYGALGFFLVLHAMRRQHDRFAVLSMSVIPFVMLFRRQYLFSGLAVNLLAVLILWAIFAPREFWQLMRSPLPCSLLVAGSLYWFASYLQTGSYSSNLHVVEFAESAACIFLLGKHRSKLVTAFLGIAGTTAIVAIACWVAGGAERLGELQFGADAFGNPILLGLPTAFVLLLGMADGGRWLGVQRRPILRATIVGLATVCLLATTSRGSWLVAAVGLIVIVFGSRQDRRSVLIGALTVLPLGAALALTSSRGAAVATYFDRAFSSDRTLAQRTTGRATMWAALPSVVAEEPVLGFGAGLGSEVMIRFTDRNKMWHALFLQIIVETGLPGTLYLIVMIGALILRAVRHRQMTGEVTPLIGIFGYLAAGLSINALEGLSGILIGLALLAGETSAFRFVRIARPDDLEQLTLQSPGVASSIPS